MEQLKKQSKPMTDEYKGVKKESVVATLTDKNGNKTTIKL